LKAKFVLAYSGIKYKIGLASKGSDYILRMLDTHSHHLINLLMRNDVFGNSMVKEAAHENCKRRPINQS